MFILIRLTQHVSSITMLIVRRTDCTKKLRVVYALLCWLHHTQFFCLVCSPDDEHNDARNMLS